MRDYIIARDAVLSKCGGIWDGWEPITSLDELKTYATKESGVTVGATWVGPKFPKDLAAKVLACIAKFPRRETEYMMYFDLIKQEWHIKVPKQRGSGAAVHYEDDAKGLPDGCVVIGTIHTHPEMSAFWSGTDMNDQKDKHGLHIVFGTKDGYPTQWKVTRFFPGGYRDLELLDVWEELPKKEELPEPPEEWMAILNTPLEEVKTPVYTYGGTYSTRPSWGGRYNFGGTSTHGYDIGSYRYAYSYPYDNDDRLDYEPRSTHTAPRSYSEEMSGESVRDALSGVIGLAIDTVGFDGLISAMQYAFDVQGLDVVVGDPEMAVRQGIDILMERGELEDVLDEYGITAVEDQEAPMTANIPVSSSSIAVGTQTKEAIKC